MTLQLLSKSNFFHKINFELLLMNSISGISRALANGKCFPDPSHLLVHGAAGTQVNLSSKFTYLHFLTDLSGYSKILVDLNRCTDLERSHQILTCIRNLKLICLQLQCPFVQVPEFRVWSFAPSCSSSLCVVKPLSKHLQSERQKLVKMIRAMK